MYVVDSTVIIDLYRHFGHREVRKALRGLALQNKLRIPEGVQREIGRKTDQARKMVEELAKNSPDCVARIAGTPHLSTELVRIEQVYGERIRLGKQEYLGLWKSASGRKAADGQVVAVAKRLGATVVSDDKAIQRVCLCENVACIGWTEFARTCGLHRQSTLFA